MTTSTHNPPRVLVTDGGFKHTLGAVRHLSRDGFQVDAIGSPPCISQWSRHLHGLPCDGADFCDERFDAFLRFLEREKYDVLLPISSTATVLVARHMTEVQRHCRVPIASAEKIELCFDKARINEFAATHNVKGPKTWHPSSLEQLDAMLDQLEFPVVIKRLSEIGDFGTFYADSVDEVREVFRPLTQRNGSVDPLPVIQQRIIGPGEGFFALYDRGVCKRVFMHRRIRETPPSGGASCCAMSIFEDDLMAAGKRMLDGLQWHGVAMAEFKRDARTGQLYLLEINPKFWGSLDLALQSGVNFPALAARVAMGEDIGYSQEYRVGLKYHWPLNGELKHLAAAPAAIGPIVLDCLNPFVRSNIWLSDPMPAVFSVTRQLAAGWNSVARFLGRRSP